MKIGEFSKKFNVPVSTIRHYIHLGLLVPEKDGSQYNFTDIACREMEIISSMKAVGFKLNELGKYLSIFRFYNKDDYLLYEKLVDDLKAKKDSLYAERNQINTYIRLINKKIEEIEASNIYAAGITPHADTETAKATLPGFPLRAVSLLRCPCCQSKLNLFNVDISGDSIINGILSCTCGYSAIIKNGILFTDEKEDLGNDPNFLDLYFGKENLITNEDGILLMAMNEYSNDILANLHRSSLWIHKELESFDLSGKTILFPDMACQYLYSYGGGKNTENSIFLITSLAERAIHTMRQHIANANPDLKVAYIINRDGKLPLRANCVDAIIDYIGSINLGFFIKEHYFDMIAPYMAKNAIIAGAVEYYNKGSDSLKKIQQLYSNASPEVLTLDFVNTALRNNGFKIKKSEKIGEGYDPGRFFEYHIAGDIRTNMVYLAKRELRS